MLSPDSFILTPLGARRAGEIAEGDSIYLYVSPNICIHNVKSRRELVGDAVTIKYYSKDVCVVPANSKVVVSDERRKHILKEKSVSAITNHDLIHRKILDVGMGMATEPHAYSIGALLGDGCCCEGGNAIYISADSDDIPRFIKNQLKAKYVRKNSRKNYTYVISNGVGHASNIGHPVVECNYYNQWCKNKKAHQKIIDLDVIKTWNRNSCIKLLAGLLDTDGSVEIDEMRVTVSWHSQSKSIVDAIHYLVLSLWQTEPLFYVDNREKYVNGPVYTIYVRKNLFSMRMLEECAEHLLKKDISGFSEKTHKACYSFIKPRFIRDKKQQFLDFGTDGFILTANQGILIGRNR